MNEFISNNNEVVDQAFDDFQATHGKEYKHKVERNRRKNTFRNNFRLVFLYLELPVK